MSNTLLNIDEFYHGTDVYSAFKIIQEGFKLVPRTSKWGKNGTFGAGTYLTKNIESAKFFGECIIKCRLKKNIKLLHLTGAHDVKTINYLKKEFSKDILFRDIRKILPSNKHLTNKELIALLNYRYQKLINKTTLMGKKTSNYKVYQKSMMIWDASVSSIRQQLRNNKYEGIGETIDIIGVIIFNPSAVEPIEIEYCCDKSGDFKKFDKDVFLRNLKNYMIDNLKDGIISTEEYDKFIIQIGKMFGEATPFWIKTKVR